MSQKPELKNQLSDLDRLYQLQIIDAVYSSINTIFVSRAWAYKRLICGSFSNRKYIELKPLIKKTYNNAQQYLSTQLVLWLRRAAIIGDASLNE